MKFIVLLAAATGCAGHLAGDAALSDRVRGMRTDHAKMERRVEEMENRLMLLEDRLDTRRVADEADGRTPTLPVVHLTPPPAPAAAAADGAADTADAVERVTDEVVPDDDAPRPMLRLHGNAGGRGRSSEPPVVTEEKLPVVPLPKTVPAPAPAAASRASTPSQPAEPGPGQDPLVAYRKSHELLQAGKIDEAQRGFETFLREHPDHDYADNAAYWAAECHYARRDWTAAVAAFRRVIDQYPRGNKAPDALLKLGFTYYAAGDRAAAVQVLEQVTRTYARAQVAALAQAKLEEIHD